MSKQDRQGVRTPADLERKYPLGKLNDPTGDTSELSKQISQMNQSMSIFATSINGTIAEMSSNIDTLNKDVADLKYGGGGSGQASVVVVNVEADSLDTETLSADKTFSDIEQAILAGMDVKVKLKNESYYIYLQMTAHLPESEVDFCGYYDGHPLVLQIFADE